VIECFTKENFLLNGVTEARFEVGEWKDVTLRLNKQKSVYVATLLTCFRFDVILTSETIYNEADYESLHDALNGLLAEDGVV